MDAAYKAADAAIQADVDANEAAAEAAVKAVQDDVDANQVAMEAADKVNADAIAAETARAQAAEAELVQDVADILSNTDITAVDSFTEVIAATNNALREQANNYTKLQLGTVDAGLATFTPSATITSGSEQIFVNGLLQTMGNDYISLGNAYQFTNEAAQLVGLGARVTVHGVNAVVGSISATSAEGKVSLKDATARVDSGEASFESDAADLITIKG